MVGRSWLGLVVVVMCVGLSGCSFFMDRAPDPTLYSQYDRNDMILADCTDSAILPIWDTLNAIGGGVTTVAWAVVETQNNNALGQNADFSVSIITGIATAVFLGSAIIGWGRRAECVEFQSYREDFIRGKIDPLEKWKNPPAPDYGEDEEGEEDRRGRIITQVGSRSTRSPPISVYQTISHRFPTRCYPGVWTHPRARLWLPRS